MSNGRRPVHSLMSVHRGTILNDPARIKAELEEMHPDQGGGSGLGVARVTNIDYEEMYVTLRTLIGTEQEFERVPVPLTFPGAGCRHFLGAMPEIGDHCIVGWLPQESSARYGGTRSPVILTWIIPGVWPGRDWLTTSTFDEDEHDSASPKSREVLKGWADRVRHKLRHIQPGNIVASSSQGADLILDESVHLANRRGNEFILRDQDQAAVLRALQRFDALAGTRIYAGMVQRDALRLPTTMFSDGVRWDGAIQAINGDALTEDQLPAHLTAPDDTVTPAHPLARALDDEGDLGGALHALADNLDPYVFLRNGGYIDEDGSAIDDLHRVDAEYGGKPIFRVSAQGGTNAVIDDVPTLTEHRIEVAHTSDGRLPVTEQTDLFDAERLPPSDSDTPGTSSNAPYIEWVLGSVVGNDPFSQRGRKQYGIPLVAQVFDSTGGVSPTITPALIGGVSGAGTPLAEHMATLFKLDPISGRAAPTWWSVNKKGQVRGNISGSPAESSFDLAVGGAFRMALGGALNVQVNGGLQFITQSKDSLVMRAEQGPLKLYGGNSDQGVAGALERIQGTNEGNIPSVDIHARTNAVMRAERHLLLKGQTVEANASSFRVQGHNEIDLVTAKRFNTSAEHYTSNVSGKRVDNFTGPKGLLPTNGALHERKYTPNFPGVVAEEVVYEMGDREERFLLGNHTTEILIGDQTYRSQAGTFTAQGTGSKLELAPTGVTLEALVGNVTLTATAGSVMMQATTGVIMQATSGPLIARGSSFVLLGAPIVGTDIGSILCGGSREPFTNLPFATWGIGAANHIIGP